MVDTRTYPSTRDAVATATSRMMDGMPTAPGRSTLAVWSGMGTPTPLPTACRETAGAEWCTGSIPHRLRPHPKRQSSPSKCVVLSTPPDGDQPSQLWPYRYANGELAGYVARWDRPGGGKEIRPLVLRDGRWRQKGIDSPRPLYNLSELGERPDAPVLVVEGEKTSDAAGKLVASHVPTTSMGGAKAPRFSDWKPLAGREVVIWPDNDADGQQYARSGCGPGP